MQQLEILQNKEVAVHAKCVDFVKVFFFSKKKNIFSIFSFPLFFLSFFLSFGLLYVHVLLIVLDDCTLSILKGISTKN